MSMLLEKRQAIVNKINALIAERNNAIEAKVAIYREQLESEPASKELVDAKHILTVIDEVIAYDNDEIAKSTSVSEVASIATATIECNEAVLPQEATIVNNMANVQVTHVVADERPGMTAIVTPERS